MKIILINTLLLVFFIANNIFSQKVEYKYDAHGNRTQRKLVVGIGTGRMAQPKDNIKTKETIEKDGQLIMKHGISVFPNPTNDKVVVSLSELKQDENKNIMLYLVDNIGKIITKQPVTDSQTLVDLNGYKSGVYYIKVKFDKEDLFYKVIKTD